MLQCRVLHGRLSCLQSTNSVAHLNKWYWPHFLVVLLPCSHPPSPHAGQLEKGDPTDQGHCQKGTSSEMSYKNVTRSECFTHTHKHTHTHTSRCSRGKRDCIIMATHDVAALAISIYHYRRSGNFQVTKFSCFLLVCKIFSWSRTPTKTFNSIKSILHSLIWNETTHRVQTSSCMVSMLLWVV